MTKESLDKDIKKLTEISNWFEDQKDIDIELGLKKVKEASQIIKKTRKRFKEIENEFEEIKKQIEE